MRELIIFDLDDTLVDTSDVYWTAKRAFMKIILEHTSVVKRDELDDLFEIIDTENLLRFGHSPKRYGISMLDTYNNLRRHDKIQKSSRIKEEIEAAAKIITEQIPSLIDGAIEMLEWCKDRFILSLITRGENSLQLKKIYAYSFQKYFQRIDIVEKKDDLKFLEIIREFNLDITNTWIIGDSLKAEIETGLRLGAKCIFFDYKHDSYNWIQERNYSISSKKAFYKVDRLGEIPGILIQER